MIRIPSDNTSPKNDCTEGIGGGKESENVKIFDFCGGWNFFERQTLT
jgi:hypothetical protein